MDEEAAALPSPTDALGCSTGCPQEGTKLLLPPRASPSSPEDGAAPRGMAKTISNSTLQEIRRGKMCEKGIWLKWAPGSKGSLQEGWEAGHTEVRSGFDTKKTAMLFLFPGGLGAQRH